MNTPTPDNNFYCKEWNNVGFICEEQCDSCKCHDKPTHEEMTPTPEQLEKKCFAEFHEQYDKLFEKDYMDYRELEKLCTAYANHVLTNHEGFQSNAELKRKLAAFHEQLELANLSKELATGYANDLRRKAKVIDDLQQQLTEARKEIEGLKAKTPIECDHNWYSSVLFEGKRVCSKCNKYK